MKKINRSRLFLTAMLAILLFSCSKKKVDTIFYNGKVYVVNANFSETQAFAILNGKIKSTGYNDDILDEFEANETIDLKGATVFPGFIDAHSHFYGYATDQAKCDLYGSTSFEEIVSRVTEYAKTNTFSWILGRGWDQNDWQYKTYPTREILDSLFPEIPVYLMRIDGHAVLCNEKALLLAGITAETKVEGGEVLIKDGKPTGLLIDNAIELVKKKIPKFDDAIIKKALVKAQEDCFKNGLTTVTDAGIGKDTIFTLLEAQKSGELKIRINAMISDEKESMNYFLKQGPVKNDRMTIQAIKIYADGALGSRGACMKREYNDRKGHFGFMLHSAEYFEAIADEAMEAGFQLCVHAIGDSANKVIIDLYKKQLTPENHRRWRIEHCQVVDPKDRKNMSEYAIIPSVQPLHATSDMYWAQERIGKERMAYAYAYEDLRDECEGIIAFGTDFPVESINPIHTFYAAVVRKDIHNFPKGGFQPENKIKRTDAIKAMTINAAYANFEEEIKGSLEEGKFADFIILNKDLMKVDDKDILKTKILATYVNGEKVYDGSWKE